jgi:L-aspartate oxidase
VARNFTSEDDWGREIRQEIQRTMWNAAGIVRTTAEMEAALTRLRELSAVCDKRAKTSRGGTTMSVAEINNLLVVGQLMLRCALMRKESRGLHYTLDYPEPVESEKKPSFLFDVAEESVVSFEDARDSVSAAR